MIYYKKELDDMGKWAEECNIAILDSMQYFMNEADQNMSGIDRDIVDRITDNIRKFKQHCNCYDINKLTTKRR
jgi:isochorismate hydrolase